MPWWTVIQTVNKELKAHSGLMHLQLMTVGVMSELSANTQDGARLDIVADGFWGESVCTIRLLIYGELEGAFI